ncbi:hypothetical protein BC830DRAFT_1088988 [Chytriomyces sp. MP71]|nr:hypothetical protein BC830DRAFT_1088988 [Chytriomyces sp. MP71]
MSVVEVIEQLERELQTCIDEGRGEASERMRGYISTRGDTSARRVRVALVSPTIRRSSVPVVDSVPAPVPDAEVRVSGSVSSDAKTSLVKAMAAFVSHAFRCEPLGLSCGRPALQSPTEAAEDVSGFINLIGSILGNDGAGIALLIYLAPSESEHSLENVSVDDIVCVNIAEPHSSPDPAFAKRALDPSTQFDSVGERIRASFVYMDAIAAKSVSLHHVMEYAICATAPEFRGGLIGPAVGVPNSLAHQKQFKWSIYQRAGFALEQIVRLIGGYNALYSHSHNISGARRAECGWQEIARVPYSDLPSAVTPVQGDNMVFMYKEL